MADNIEVGDLVARISFDDTGLNSSMAAINRQMQLVQSEFSRASTALGIYGEGEERLAAQSTNLSQQMQLQQQRINKLNEAFQESAREKGLDAAETQRLATQLNRAHTEFNQLGRRLQEVNAELADQREAAGKTESAWERLEKTLDGVGDKFKQVGDKMKNVGGSLTTGLTAPLLAFGGLAVKTAADFDGSAKRIQAALGVTAEEAEALNEEAKALWTEGFGENIGEAASAILLVKQQIQGLNNSEIKSLAEDALILQEVFQADINDSVSTARVLMQNFGIEGGHAMDLITVGFQRGGDYSGELLDTLREYAPQFDAMGIGADQMLAILISGAEAGAYSLDKVGDAVKEFNIRAADGSKATAEGFAAIGLDADIMGAAIAAGGEVAGSAFQATLAALAAMDDPLQQNIAGVALFGTQWEDVRSQVVLAMDASASSLGEIEGATKAAGDALQEGFGKRATAVWRDFQKSLEPVGQILIDVAEDWLPKLSAALESVAGWLANLSPGMQGFIISVGAILGVLGPLLVAFGFVAQGIGAIISVVTAVIGAFSAGGAAATALGAAFTFLTGPVGIAIAAVAALIAIVVLIVKNWEPIKGFFANLWKGISEIFVANVEKIKTFFSGLFAWVKNFFTKWGPEILTAVAPAIGAPLLIIKHWDAIKEGLSTAVKNATAAIINGFTVALNWLKNLHKEMVQIGVNIIQGLIDGLGKMLGRVKDKVREIANAVTEGTKNLLGIHSPSRVMMELGEYTGEGMALGLKKSLSGVAQQAAAMSKAAIPAIESAPGSRNAADTQAAPSESVIHNYVILDGRQIEASVSKRQNANVTARSRGLGYA